MIRRSIVSSGSILCLVAGVVAIQQQRGGGPPGIFHSSIPAHDVSVVQCDPTPTSSTLSLMATKDMSVQIEAKGQLELESLDLKANEPRTVKVSGLKSGSENDYRVTYEGGEVKGTLVTPKPTGTDFTFVIQADSHLDQNTTTSSYIRSLSKMSVDDPDFLLDLGDTFMNDKHAKYQDSIAQYRAQRYYLNIVGKTAPVFLALGNHDGEQGWADRNRAGMTEWSAAQRKLHFPAPTEGVFATGNTKKANYFEFQWGDAHIIVLDPYNFTMEKPGRNVGNWGWTLGEQQYRWLKNILASSKAKYKFVFVHHLVGGQGRDTRGGSEASQFFEWGGKNEDGSDGFSTKRPGWEAPIHDLLKKYQVDVVFHGHDHFYAKQDRGGIVYQLVPQPSNERGGTRSAEEYSYKSGKILSSPGYMRVKVGKNTAKVEFVRDSGTVADSYEIRP